MSADKVLSRLTRVKRTAPGKWIASCPAHDDKSPSLAVREVDDGRVLLHCFGGCSVESVLGVIGLEMTDLFPPQPDAPGAGHKPQRRPFIPADAFDIARREIGIGAVILADVFALKEISDVDRDRLLQAVQTLDRIAEVAYAN